MSQPSENERIRKVLLGDERTLNTVYQDHRGEFLQWARKTFDCTEETAKDAYQLAFFVFYENILTGKLADINSSIKTYLFAIGKNKIFEQLRREARYCRVIKEELLGFDIADNSYLEKEEKYQQLESGLEQLGSPCREIIEMTYYERRSMEYITQKLGYKNAATTKNQKYKCMQRLKKLTESIAAPKVSK
jgi:RNA polymerase sigma-70 factor (ECF subfamily)